MNLEASLESFVGFNLIEASLESFVGFNLIAFYTTEFSIACVGSLNAYNAQTLPQCCIENKSMLKLIDY